MTEQEIQVIFEETGGEFISPPVVLSKKLNKISALIFDWDGVWHDGKKDGSGYSSFSEVDSMGLNMLRFGYYLLHKEIPQTFIITGEKNQTALQFAKREHLDGVFTKAKDKVKTFRFMQEEYGLAENEVLFVFDDILDLALAEIAHVRFLVNRAGSPLMQKLAIEKEWCDYKTAATGSTCAVREVCELSLGLLDVFERVVTERMHFSEVYARYWQVRNNKQTRFFTSETGSTVPFDL